MRFIRGAQRLSEQNLRGIASRNGQRFYSDYPTPLWQSAHASAAPISFSGDDWAFLMKNSFERMRSLQSPYGAALAVEGRPPLCLTGLIKPSEESLCPLLSHPPLEKISPYESSTSLYPFKATCASDRVYFGRHAMTLTFEAASTERLSASLWVFDRGCDTHISESPIAIVRGQGSLLPSHSLDPISVCKGGLALEIEPLSVHLRSQTRRSPSQLRVMGYKASQAVSSLLSTYSSDISLSEALTLTQGVEAAKMQAYTSPFHPEWCHLYGYSLSPMSANPQHPSNLGAAPRWLNNEMLICEKVLSVFAQAALRDSIEDLQIHMRSTFWSVDHVVLKALFETSLSKGERTFHTHQALSPCTPLLFRRPEESALIASLALNFLNGRLDRVLEPCALSERASPQRARI